MKRWEVTLEVDQMDDECEPAGWNWQHWLDGYCKVVSTRLLSTSKKRGARYGIEVTGTDEEERVEGSDVREDEGIR